MSATTVPLTGNSLHAKWAVGLAGIVAVGAAGLAVVYVVQGADVTDNPWVRFFAAVLLLLALLVAMPAFGMAVTAKVQRETWPALWLPLVVFPALVVFVVYGQSHLWN